MEEMEENNDTWSLLAVVRECSMRVRNKAPTPDPALTLPLPPTLTPEPAFEPISNSPFAMNGSALEPSSFGSFPTYNNADYSFDHHDLVDFYKPFLVQPSPPGVTGANVPDPQLTGSLPKADTGFGPDSGGVLRLEPHQNPHRQHQLLPAPAVDAAGGGATFQQHNDHQLLLQQGSLQNRKLQIPGACPVGIHKKKKFEERRVCKMRLEELSEDKWAWRKYGQKPIKGSPYPRNYYRCSTSKGCTARKQVERSPVERNTYLVTYTGQHYHARPPLRTPSRVTRPSDSTSSPEEESKSQTTPASATPTSAPYQNGSGSESGEPVVGKNENENEEEEGGDDEEIELIPNSMADPKLLMDMERLMNNDQRTSPGERKTGESVGNGYGYGYDMMMREIGASDPNVNFGVVVRGNGLCLGIQQKELDSAASGSAAPTTLAAAHESPNGRGRNIWDNGIINPQSFLF
ncbi:hypothetical protein Cgig2_007889 [Carnegiea gigantea]|uniref:WRKY domain-containing protein n=1 Tax=Carnegiea gigantea TaxID=171969 RepID=A0A9Q1QHV5_9CARY|nr:hypothetical protein Cgig2_007889 [Carnegiea gigantea]